MSKKNTDYLDAKLDNLKEDILELKTTIEILKADLAERRAYGKVVHWIVLCLGGLFGAAVHVLTRYLWK